MRFKRFLIPVVLLRRPVKNLQVKVSLSKIIRNKPEIFEPVEFNLTADKDNKSDSIQYVPIKSTLKVWGCFRVSLDQGNDNEGNGRLRTFKDGTAYRSNELFSLGNNSLQLVLYHDDFGTANPLENKVSKYKASAFYFV